MLLFALALILIVCTCLTKQGARLSLAAGQAGVVQVVLMYLSVLSDIEISRHRHLCTKGVPNPKVTNLQSHGKAAKQRK